jgi:dienelactone hydrolase
VSLLKQHGESTGKVGAVGFCFGGLMVNRLAVSSGELDAASPITDGRCPSPTCRRSRPR